MTTKATIDINVELPFHRAGIVFNVKAQSPAGAPEGQAPSFELSVVESSRGERVLFNVEVSPPLADWVRGYTRWLVRARVTATSETDRITGAFADGLTAEQVLGGMRDACDMIRQRFELYEESILD